MHARKADTKSLLLIVNLEKQMNKDIPPCTPHSSPFTWTTASGHVRMEWSCGRHLRSISAGPLAEVLQDHASFCDVIPSTHFSLQWAVVGHKKKQVKVFDPPFRNILAPAGWTASKASLGVVAQSCGLRRLSETSGWRMCAPNAVLHPQMGPCVTMCTDGVHVVLWDKPWPGTSWLMAHVTNITGPVTSTPTALWEWCSGATSPTAKPKLSPLQLAIQQLEKALKVA